MTDSKFRLKDWFSDKANQFVIKVFLAYGIWKLMYRFFLNQGPLSEWWRGFTYSLGTLYASVTSTLLNAVGQHTNSSGKYIVYITSLKRIAVSEHCLALPAMLIFTLSILLFTGAWKNKLWFVPLGLAGIALINIFRLALLSITFEKYSTQNYEINHSYVYVAVTYGLIFLLIYWWMKKFSTATNQ
jgi:exosortase/archaeosortase family protein